MWCKLGTTGCLPTPPTNTRPVSINESKSICGHIFFMGGCPILWKTHKENHISRSLCGKQLTSVLRMPRCSVLFFPIFISSTLPVPSPYTMITADLWFGPIRSAQKACYMSISMRMPLEKHIFWMRSPSFIFQALPILLTFSQRSSNLILHLGLSVILSYSIHLLSYHELLLAWMGGIRHLKFQNSKWVSKFEICISESKKSHFQRYTLSFLIHN